MRAVLAFLRAFLEKTAVVTGAVGLTLLFFLVLPLIQAIAGGRGKDDIIQTVDAGVLTPPPPPPVEEEPPPEEEPEEEEPEIEEPVENLDLSQLELALNPGFGDAFGGDAGTFGMELKVLGAGGSADGGDSLFSLAELDQKPRVIYQPGPLLNAKLRRRAPGKVYVIFIVNERGRVEQPKVQSSSDPIFERPALNAVKQWKFEPGKRNGKSVRFRMRVPVTFPKDSPS